MKIKFQFSGVIWKYSGKGAWYFVTIPEELSREIRDTAQWQEEGWGRLKTIAKIKDVEWETSIWFDKKANAYLLPLKADIRKQLKLEDGMKIEVMLNI
jgi:hypothetical protein